MMGMTNEFGRSANTFRRLLVAAVAALAVSILAVAGAGAQGLPSADELEEEEQTSQSEEDEEESEAPANEERQGDAETQDEAEGASETEGAGDGETEASADGEQGEQAGEQSGDGADAESDEDDKPGEIVETEESVEREMVGRESDEGDRRYVQSGLNAHGVPGFQHIASAKATRANTYDVAFFGEVTGGKNMIRAEDTNTFAGGRLDVHGQFIENFSANIGLEATNNVNSIGRPRAMLSQGDLTAALRGHYAVDDALHFAGDVTLLFPTGFAAAGPSFSGTTVTPRLLTTLEANPLIEGSDVPLSAHLNVGYRVDNTENTVPEGAELTRIERFAHDISAYDYLQLGIGVEYDVPYVSPFAAWNIEFPVNGPDESLCGGLQSLDCVENEGFRAFPSTVSLGLRGEPVEQLALHGGVDLSLTSRQAAGIPATPLYMVVLGASWNIDPRARVERVTKTIEKTREVGTEGGHIDGRVVDAETEEPIGGAQIEYLETDRSPQVTGSEDGAFRSYGFEPGRVLTIRISHPDYHSEEIEGTIRKDDDRATFKLEPKPKTATVTGTVSDAEGAGISGATVRFAGPETKEVTTDATGEFEAELKGGAYDVGATSPEHRAATDAIEVEAGESTTLSFTLEPGGDASLVNVGDGQVQVEQRIQFASGTADISEDSEAVLDQVAITIQAHPGLKKIEVQGHTDDVGGEEGNVELSEERAQAVHDYLVEQGVSAERLVTKGYGPHQPKVPNISDENRRTNRRVEFEILER